jgi:hypothetical protein
VSAGVLLVFERTGTKGSFWFNIFQPKKIKINKNYIYIYILNTNWGVCKQNQIPTQHWLSLVSTVTQF